MATGLFQAIQKYRFKQIKFLIESGLSANVRNAAGQSPLVAALRIDDDAKRERLFAFLVKNGADCSAYDVSTGRDIFTWCCYLDRTQQAHFVLADQRGNLDFQQKDKSGHAALHYAAANGNAEIVQAMIDYMSKYHISVDIRDSDGFTPYILAQRLSHTDCADLLLEAGASPQQMDAKNLRSAHDWAWIGEREKSFAAHEMHTKRVGMYRLLGRLPELKKAKYKANDIKITKSKKDKEFLEHTQFHVENAKSAQLFKQNTWLDFEKSQHKYLTRSLPNFNLPPIQEDDLERDVIIRPAAPAPSLHSSSASSLWDGGYGELEATSITSSTSEDRLFDIMKLVEQQYTHAYRPYAQKKPKPGTSGKAAKLPALDGKSEKQRKVANKMETLAIAKKSKGKHSSAIRY